MLKTITNTLLNMFKKLILLSTLVAVSCVHCSNIDTNTYNNDTVIKNKDNKYSSKSVAKLDKDSVKIEKHTSNDNVEEMDTDYESNAEDEYDDSNIEYSNSDYLNKSTNNNGKNNKRSNTMDVNTNIKKKGINNMENNNFNKKLFEDADKLDVSDNKISEKIKISQIDAKSVKSKFAKDIWIVNRKSNSVAFEMRFKHEGYRSFINDPGMLGLVFSTILEGTTTRSGKQIKELIDNKSINITIHADYDDIILNVQCLNKYFNDVIDLLCDLGTNALFPEDKVKKNKEALVLQFQQDKFKPQLLAKEKILSMACAKPYHMNIDETIKKIPQYDRKYIIENCYNKIFHPENAVITIVGNVKSENDNTEDVLLENTVVSGFNKIHDALLAKSNKYNKVNTFDPGQQTAELEVYQDKDGKEIKYEHVKLNNPQSIIMFALPGVKKTDSDKIAILAANNIFGSGKFDSRLMQSVREQNGLVYYIYTRLLSLDLQSVMIGTAATQPDNVNKVIDEIKKQITVLHDRGITEEELKNFKINKYANYTQSTSHALLDFVVNLRNDGVKVSEINSRINEYLNLKLEDVNKALRKVFDPTKIVFVSCGMDNDSIQSMQNIQAVVQGNTEEQVTENKQSVDNKVVGNNNVCDVENQINIKEKVLKNGMKVIVVPTNTKDFVQFGVGYFVGCADDSRDVRGISHFIEHMMFKQTNNLKLGDIKHYLDKYNKYTNAFTLNDITFYTHQCNKAFLELDMQIEADRMVNIQFDPKEIEKEMGAIIEERKMRVESDPSTRYAYEAILKSLYLYSPYSDPTIGYIDQIQACNAENLKEHYDKYYMPNNAFALFVGDIDIEEAVELCNKYFGNIEKGQEIVKNRVVDPENIGITNKMTHKSSQISITSIQLFYKIPRSKIDTMKKKLTISIVQNILAGGMSSVLYKQLVENKKILHDIFSELEVFPYDASLLEISAKLPSNSNIYNTEEEINSLIEEFRINALTEELFEIEKQKYMDEFELMLDNPLALNHCIVFNIASGYSIEEINNIKNILNTITYEDVKEAAKDILNIKNQALVLYQMPEKQENDVKKNDNKKDEHKVKNKKEQIKQKITDGLNKAKEKVKEIKEKTERKIRN